jgi:hypothetical protein
VVGNGVNKVVNPDQERQEQALKFFEKIDFFIKLSGFFTP